MNTKTKNNCGDETKMNNVEIFVVIIMFSTLFGILGYYAGKAYEQIFGKKDLLKTLGYKLEDLDELIRNYQVCRLRNHIDYKLEILGASKAMLSTNIDSFKILKYVFEMNGERQAYSDMRKRLKELWNLDD